MATSSSGTIMRGASLDIRCNADVSWVLERADRYSGRRLTPKSLKFYQSPCLWYAGHAVVLSTERFKIHDKYKHAAKSYTEVAVPCMLKWLEDEAGHATRDRLFCQTMGRKCWRESFRHVKPLGNVSRLRGRAEGDEEGWHDDIPDEVKPER